MSILVLNKGWLATVQDLGRPGYAQYGINRSGAMDPLALQVGNYLVGNEGPEAALEICFPASGFLFLEPTLMVLAGADFGASISGKAIRPYQPVRVAAGAELHFQHKHWGQYAYLCVQGGFDLKPWLNSQSTNHKAIQGGWQGRGLQKGDVLPLKRTKSAPREGTKISSYYADLAPFYDSKAIRFIPGQHFEVLTQSSQAQLSTQNWKITPASDRMGYRLAGEKLELEQEESLLSAGLSRGSIQLPPNGQPIVLMADHQTTGGYPILGQVIQADWPKLAQKGAGQNVYFQPTTLADAAHALKQQLRGMNRLKITLKFSHQR
ncbi:MAG: biotin-dependent carboxyltransferase family protein [Haliscomenobacter sp.]|uniref:5-oxoprolinase subunit C family protein n=1 Tax=Haliscomenobacter sp. TaxID=2717303 RepID=UPI0029AB05A8|nr:biotin-dependent carboxyltransferase family protein [Haliscomenobacter sp.]MDX2069872.1 biotin-dependent carboxyltransferase family protein [Haliscomenobacter sp.]